MAIRGSVAIVTGAAGAIGAATARLLATRGCHLVLVDIRCDELQAIARELSGLGVQALPVNADVTDRAAVDQLVQTALAGFGRIDILTNIAGVGSSPSLLDCSDDEIERVIAVNLVGPARLMHAVLPLMIAQRRGSIVNVGSVAGEAGVMGIYSASKFGLRGLSDSVRREARGANVGVTLIEPGFVRSAMNPAMAGLPGPEIVAKAIALAIEHPRRARIVPAIYALPVLLVKLLPGLTDLVFGDARIQQRLNRDSRAARTEQRA